MNTKPMTVREADRFGGKPGVKNPAKGHTTEQARQAVMARWNTNKGGDMKWEYEIGWSYPYSPDAEHFGFDRNGCWTVSKRRNQSRSWRAIAAYSTQTEAAAHLKQITTYSSKATKHRVSYTN